MSRPTVDLGYPTEPHGSIPVFCSIEEEAEFWDTHDVTDLMDEGMPVTFVVGPELAERFVLRLGLDEQEELARRAEMVGTDAAELARTWIEERLRQVDPPPPEQTGEAA